MKNKVVLKCTDDLFNLAVSVSEYIRTERDKSITLELINLSKTKSWKHFWSYFHKFDEVVANPYMYPNLFSSKIMYNTIWKHSDSLELCTLIITSMALNNPIVSEIITDGVTYNEFIKLCLDIKK